MNDYPINIFASIEDEGWIADIPALPGCSAFGESPEEALNEVLMAKQLRIESAKADRTKIPMEAACEKQRPPNLPTNEQIMNAFNRSLRTALIEHKRAGLPIVAWEDGKVVHIPAEEIEIPDLDQT